VTQGLPSASLSTAKVVQDAGEACSLNQKHKDKTQARLTSLELQDSFFVEIMTGSAFSWCS